jgi:hypothetical protein
MQVRPDLLFQLIQKKIKPRDLVQPALPNPYPEKQCGGPMRSQSNPYWFAIRGVWTEDQVLEVRFVSAFEVWPETWSTTVKPVEHEFPWNLNVLEGRSQQQLKLIQTHGRTAGGLKVRFWFEFCKLLSMSHLYTKIHRFFTTINNSFDKARFKMTNRCFDANSKMNTYALEHNHKIFDLA